MFQVKTFNGIVSSIVQNIMALSDEITDFNEGSKVRTLVEAVSMEIDECYQQMLKGIYEAVPASIYKTFGFSLLPATPASGMVTFTRKSNFTGDISIPAGTQVKVPNTRTVYSVIEDNLLAGGEDEVDVYVVANAPGISGNVTAGAITESASALSSIESVSNPHPFMNGTDTETEVERKQRFARWVLSLSRATRSAIEFAAGQAVVTDADGTVTERVSRHLVYEPCVDGAPYGSQTMGDPGFVFVYVWNGASGASRELLNAVQTILLGAGDASGKKIPGWKGAGVTVTAIAVVPETVNISATLVIENSYDTATVREEVQDALESYFATLSIGEPALRSRIVETIMGIDGVADVNVIAPAANFPPQWNGVCSLGTVVLN